MLTDIKRALFVFSLACALTSGESVFAANKGKARNSVRCTKKELGLKSCKLQLEAYRLSLSPEKITIDNDVWKEVHPLPLVGEKVTWQRVQLRRLKKRWIVEVEMWTEPEGEAEVQDLHWVVFELKNVKWNKHVEEVIQKRRRRLQEAQAANRIRFQSDGKEKYGLTLKKSGKISWRVGKLHGDF